MPSRTEDSRKRVLLVIDEATIGGGQQHVLLVARHLDRQRFSVAVACQGSGMLVDELRRMTVPVYPVTLTNKPSLASLRRMKGILQESAPDVVHTHGGTAGVVGRIAGKMWHCRLVHTYHGLHYLHARLPKRILFTAADRMLVKVTDRIVCVARGDYNLGLRCGVVDPTKTVVIRNGIEFESYSTMAEASGVQRRRHGVPVIGTIGRLHEQKGHRILIEAARRLHDRHIEFRVDIIGEGELRAALQRQIVHAGLDGIVRLLGNRTDIPACLADIDVFVLPSLWEGLPFALLEAMAAGVPVVASAVDGILEVVNEGENGLLVAPSDAAALAGALQRLLQNPTERQALAEGARVTVRERFDVRTMVHSLQKLYEEIL